MERVDVGDLVVAFFRVWRDDAYRDEDWPRTSLLYSDALRKALDVFLYDVGIVDEFRRRYLAWERRERWRRDARRRQQGGVGMNISSEIQQVVKLAEAIKALSAVNRQYLLALVAAGAVEATVVKTKRTYRKRQVPVVTQKRNKSWSPESRAKATETRKRNRLAKLAATNPTAANGEPGAYQSTQDIEESAT